MSSHNIKKPNGGVTMRRVMEQPDPNENLLERVLSRDNMQKAWKRVKANNGVPGMDNMSIDDFPEFARAQWDRIRDSLMAGTYQPYPVKRVEIPKPTGGKRPLGIPTVLDRLIQQAVYQVLMPIFDPDFSEFSYGFRPGRSAHDAVRKVRGYIQQGYRIAVDMDLSKFFDRVNHDVLMHRVARKIRDKRILRLIGKYLRAGVVIRYKKLSQYIRGWMNYFGISEYYRPIPEIDHWLRRRMRMCYWKQWRRPRTKIKNLLKLGTLLKAAMDVGLSRKGPWRLARTLATQTGMTNQWLKDQGLLSVKELWVNIHYPVTAR